MSLLILFLLLNPIYAFFSNKSIKHGNIGFGKVPDHVHPILDNFSHQIDLIANNEQMKHIYISELSNSLKSNFEQLKNDLFWNQLTENNHSKIVHIDGMEELYFSNPKFKKNNNMIGLYGSTNNLYLHRDCEYICTFPNIKVYRVLIGLSDNKNMITNIPHANLSYKLEKYDYLFFDYSRTHHQVLKDNVSYDNNARKIIKIHFMVFDNNTPIYYQNLLTNYFTLYNTIFRFWSNMGLEPETYFQFFFGLSNQLFYTPNITFLIGTAYIAYFFQMYIAYNFSLKRKNVIKYMSYPIISLFSSYCIVVLFYWLRFKIVGIR